MQIIGITVDNPLGRSGLASNLKVHTMHRIMFAAFSRLLIILSVTSAAFAQSPPQPSSQTPVTSPPPVAKTTPAPSVVVPSFEQLYRVVQPPVQYEPVAT